MIPTLTGNAETGTFSNEMSYARVGRGPRTLVVLPGFGDAMFSGTFPPLSEWTLVPYFGRYLDEYTVYLLSRPRGLPPGYDAETAIETHAPVLESLADRNPASLDVIGISMGGLIGQALACRRPNLIDRLVLANSACRIADAGIEAVHRLEGLARNHDWFEIRSQLVRDMFSDARAIAYPPLIHTLGRFALPRPAEPADTWRSLEFVLEFDGCDRLTEIEQPTLVFGGDQDPYFAPPVARETATRLPAGELTLVPGGKHGAFHAHKRRFDRRVTAFLER